MSWGRAVAAGSSPACAAAGLIVVGGVTVTMTGTRTVATPGFEVFSVRSAIQNPAGQSLSSVAVTT